MSMNITAVTAGTIFLVLLSVWLAHRLARARDRERAMAEVARPLKETLERHIAQLASGSIDAHYLMSREGDSLEALITRFATFVPTLRGARYAAAAITFHERREALSPALIEHMRRQATGSTDDQSGAPELLSSLQEILTFVSS